MIRLEMFLMLLSLNYVLERRRNRRYKAVLKRTDEKRKQIKDNFNVLFRIVKRVTISFLSKWEVTRRRKNTEIIKDVK